MKTNPLPILGLLLLVPPAYLLARWIHIFNQASSHEDRVAAFALIFPLVLRDPVPITLFAFVCAAAATVVGALGVVQCAGWRWALGAATVVTGSVLSGWFLWTLL